MSMKWMLAEQKERLEAGNEGSHLMVNASSYMKDRVCSLPRWTRRYIQRN